MPKAHTKIDWDQDVQIAKDLCYPDIVIARLAAEPDPSNRQRILRDARMGKYGEGGFRKCEKKTN